MSEATAQFEEIKIPLPEPVHGLDSVTGTLGVPEWWPTGARVAVVIAQAAAGPDPLLDAIQKEMTARKVLTLRFPMPYMQAGKRKPDDIRVMRRTYHAAVTMLSQDPSAAPAHVYAGGKNMGAMVAAEAATTRMRIEGLFFLGYPLHPQDDTSEVHADHLYRVVTPMLFVQGDHDRHCDLSTLRKSLGRVGAPVQLHIVRDADHQLHVPKKSGRTNDQVNTEVLGTLETWVKKTLGDSL